MLDLILGLMLLSFLAGIFALGFHFGNLFKTYKEMFASFKAYFRHEK